MIALTQKNTSGNTKNTTTETAILALDTSKTTLSTVEEDKFAEKVKDVESEDDTDLPSQDIEYCSKVLDNKSGYERQSNGRKLPPNLGRSYNRNSGGHLFIQ